MLYRVTNVNEITLIWIGHARWPSCGPRRTSGREGESNIRTQRMEVLQVIVWSECLDDILVFGPDFASTSGVTHESTGPSGAGGA